MPRKAWTSCCDKTSPPGIPPLEQAVFERVLALTFKVPTKEATHWTGTMMAAASGISVSSM